MGSCLSAKNIEEKEELTSDPDVEVQYNDKSEILKNQKSFSKSAPVSPKRSYGIDLGITKPQVDEFSLHSDAFPIIDNLSDVDPLERSILTFDTESDKDSLEKQMEEFIDL